MTEPTWKDELLREWEKDGLEPWTDAVLQQHKAPRNAIPTDVLVVLVLAQAVETNHGADYYRLRSLIDAELARGRRARARAAAIIAEYAPAIEPESYDDGRIDAAREILEVFDGE
jgi:hypothetical protein